MTNNQSHEIDVKVIAYEINVGFSINFKDVYAELSYSTVGGWTVDFIEDKSKSKKISVEELKDEIIKISDENDDVKFIISQIDRALYRFTDEIMHHIDMSFDG